METRSRQGVSSFQKHALENRSYSRLWLHTEIRRLVTPIRKPKFINHTKENISKDFRNMKTCFSSLLFRKRERHGTQLCATSVPPGISTVSAKSMEQDSKNSKDSNPPTADQALSRHSQDEEPDTAVRPRRRQVVDADPTRAQATHEQTAEAVGRVVVSVARPGVDRRKKFDTCLL